jgi:hypothetical protein
MHIREATQALELVSGLTSVRLLGLADRLVDG